MLKPKSTFKNLKFIEMVKYAVKMYIVTTSFILQSVAENVRGGTVLEANFGNPLLGNQRKKYLKPNTIPLMFLSVAFYLELLPVTSPFMLKVMFRSARIVLYCIAGFIM